MSKRGISITQNVGEVHPGGTVVGMQVIYQGEPVLIPSPEDIQLHRAELTKIENYSRWADDFYIREEGKVLPLYASPYEDDSGRKREDLLKTIRAHERLLVLGDPGIGKTVAMERMMWETAQSAEPVVVPILVQLLYFQGADLVELIRVALNETRRLTFDNLISVHAFLRETKCQILLDGLNEVPGRQREQVIGAIANLMREYPDHRYVVTSRSQDELWRKLRSGDLITDAVVVQNISDAQAQGYLEARLGEKTGRALYNQLDDSLKALARTPLLLKLIRDAGQGSDQLPRNRGELFDKFVMNKLLEREKKLELVETPEAKKNALAHLAFALQVDHQLVCDREWAEKVLTEKGLGNKAASILNEALLHGLLLQQYQPEKKLLRFMHQSVQEYFVALTLLREAKIEKDANPLQYVARQLSKRNLRVWAKDAWWNESFVQLSGLVNEADWLARRIVNASPWLAWWCVEEGQQVQEITREMIEARSIKLLHSESITERRRAVQTLARIKNERTLGHLLFAAGDDDGEVAGLSVQTLVEMEEAVNPLVRNALQNNDRRAWQASFRYLTSQPDNPLLSEIRAMEPLLFAAGHDDLRIAKLGVRALVKMGDAVYLRMREAFRGDNKHDRQASFRFWTSQLESIIVTEIPVKVVEEILGHPMVWVPVGAFLMGSDKEQHSLTLPGYWIGRYPVTVAQWRVFMKESNHKAEQKSMQDPDNHPVCYVSWNDAMAYCKWLSDKTGLPITLPSEAEWEKAARSTDGRIYPWGDEFDKEKCNTYESGIRNTTPVGKYSPAGDSPYGCADMAGNVPEWTRSKYKNYPYNAKDGREDLAGSGTRVVRGGAWRHNQDGARVSFRSHDFPTSRFNGIGFRVVVRPPSL